MNNADESIVEEICYKLAILEANFKARLSFFFEKSRSNPRGYVNAGNFIKMLMHINSIFLIIIFSIEALKKLAQN